MARGAKPLDPPSDGGDQAIARTQNIFTARGESALGAELREVREGLGQDLHQISSVLNIRVAYLEAIEEGRFDDLPGSTYALGFVRAYAAQLGLDPDAVIERFKHEAEGIYRTTLLSFPEPVAEARIPGGAILLISAFLALFAYGGWYIYSANDIDIADLVPKVPERFMALVGGDGAEPSEGVGQGVKDAEKPAEASAEAPAGSDAAKKALDPDAAPPKPVETAAAPTASESPIPKPSSASRTEVAAPSSPNPVTEPAPPPAPITVPAPAPAATEMAAVPAVPEVPEQAATPPPDTRAYGVGNTGSRITVRARSDSWIQVREANNTLLITRILRAGDSYRVPNLKGLRLMTGNAGALDILVDGKLVAPIGLFGVVRRRVLLDPERLIAGTAVAE